MAGGNGQGRNIWKKVSAVFLAYAAASNPKTAEWLENTLSQMPDCITTKCIGVFESDPSTEESKKMLKKNKEKKAEQEKQSKKKLE